MFYKCFGVQFDDKFYKDVRYVVLVYKRETFLDYFQRTLFFVAILHYPKQILLSTNHRKWISVEHKNNTDYDVNVQVRGAEIMQRRNKANEKCMLDGRHYDDLVLKRHIEIHGCRSPYHMGHNQMPICSTKKKMNESRYDMLAMSERYHLSLIHI